MEAAETYTHTHTHTHTQLRRCLAFLCFLISTPSFAMVMNHDMSSTSGHSSGGVISQVDDKVCSKGYVYLNNQCTLCTSNPAWIKIANEWRMYCSGVTKGQLLTNPNGPLVNQQLTKCPNGSWPNDKLDDCVCAYGGTMKNGKCEGMKLSKKDLYYGPKGATAPLYKQCWTKITDNAYKVCMGFDNDITGNIFWSSGDNSINNTTTANQANGNTTNVNNTDVHDYQNVDLSKMSEQQACVYWKGLWENNTCKNPYGPGKASRFFVYWFSNEKKFKCLNVPEAVEAGLETGSEDWVNYHKQDINVDRPWAYKNALWDPIVKECTSESERACRDTGIGSWSSTNNKCYLFSENKDNCKSVGAKYTENNGIQRCDCVLDDKEFHWTSKDGCEYEYTKPVVLEDGKTLLGKGHTGGIVPNTQSSPVELCINGLIKNGFLQSNQKLNCK